MDCLSHLINNMNNITEITVPTDSLMWDIQHVSSMLYKHILNPALFNKINSKKKKLIVSKINTNNYTQLSDYEIRELKKKYFSENTIVIGISSPLSIINFPTSLLSAIKYLRNEKYNIELLLLKKPKIGKYNLSENMYNKINSYEWIKIIDVENKDMLNYLKICDILASTCRDYSNHVNHTIAMQEYMVCNRPILSSRGREIERMLGKNYYGFYDCDTCNIVPPIFYIKGYLTNSLNNQDICKIYFNNNLTSSFEVDKIVGIIKKSISLNNFTYNTTKQPYSTYNSISHIPIVKHPSIYNQDRTIYPESNVKIVMVTCVYGRHELLKIFLDYTLKLPIHKIVAVYSESKDKKILDQYPNVDAIYHINLPLSRKWNCAVISCKKHNPDAIIITGSDDLLSRNYINYCKHKIDSGYYLIGTKCWTNLFIGNGYSYLCKAHYPGNSTNTLGLGRCISKNLLDKLNWSIYPFCLLKIRK